MGLSEKLITGSIVPFAMERIYYWKLYNIYASVASKS